MTVISNPLLLKKKAAAGGSGSYEISRSLRFNDPDTPYLKRVQNRQGDMKRWTWSCWLKIAHPTEDAHIFGAYYNSDNRDNIYFGGDNWLGLNFKNNGSWHVDKFTDRLFHDPSAWHHIVVTFDAQDSTAANRARIYVDGVLNTTWGGSVTNPNQYSGSIVNLDESTFYIGAGPDNGGNLQSSHFGGLLSDIHLIDGLSLSPAAFASYDTNTGVWSPKAFALPAPNQNYTYSTGSNWTSSGGTLSNHANLFDGNVSTSIASSGGGTYTITFPTPLDCNAQVEVAQAGFGGYYQLNTGEDDAGERLHSNNFGSTNQILKAPTSGKLKKFTIHANGSDNINVKWIKVDDVTLVDGVTDPTTRNNPNLGIKWSGGSVTGAVYSGYPWTKCFDGKLGSNDGTSGASGVTTVLTLPVAQTGLIDVYLQGNSVAIQVNGSTQATTGAVKDTDTDCWRLHLGQMTLTSIGVGDSNELRGIAVDGHLLLDDTVDNSFHLKFNDTSSATALGTNSFLHSANMPTAAGAVLKVKTNNTSFAVDSGTNYDLYKSNLVLAIAGNTIADHSHTIKGSGSAVSLTSNGSIATSSAQSKFYGTSIYFDGSDDYIDTDAIDTDANSKFCVEYWMRTDVLDGCRPFNGSDNLNGTAYLYTELLATGGLKCRQADLGIIEAAAGTISANTWHHIAYTYDGTTERLFIDGVLKASDTSGSWTPPSDMKFRLGADESNAASGKYKGYLQDARVYFGTAKYTIPFTPAPCNFTPDNLVADAATTYQDRMSGTAEHSSGGTGTDTLYPLLFDGTLASPYLRPDDGEYLTYTETRSGVTDIALHTHYPSANTANGTLFKVNGSAVTPSSKTNNGWTVLPAPGDGNLTSFAFGHSGSDYVYVSGIRINNVTLRDYKVHESDIFTDSPTSYGTDAGAGGEVRGNYCTLNPLAKHSNITLSEGNLYMSTSGTGRVHGTMAVSSGKWYYEFTWDGSGNHSALGWALAPGNATSGSEYNTSDYLGKDSGSWIYYGYDGKKANNNSFTAYGAGYVTDGDTVGVAFDADTRTLWFSKNGTWQNSATATEIKNGTTTNAAFTGMGSAGERFVPAQGEQNAKGWFNFGQRAFKYTAPDGFKALCTQNLPNTFSGEEAGSVDNPSKFFDVLAYTGNGDSSGISRHGLGFSPDMVWIKARDKTYNHHLHDRVITDLTSNGGAIFPNLDGTFDGGQGAGLTAFNSDGFTTKQSVNLNESGEDYVAWCWDAGTAGAANNEGSINVTNQWANPKAGISITKYVSNNTAGATIGHGLNAAPEFIMIKCLDVGQDWTVFHKSVGKNKFLKLNLDAMWETDSSSWNQTDPDADVFTIGNSARVNDSNNSDYIAYCFTGIPGYSSFGYYIGTGDADGVFVNTGFKPNWLMTKRGSQAGQNWSITDGVRSIDNANNKGLYADLDNIESSSDRFDYYANGFKAKSALNEINTSGETYVYAAFAEHPFKTARAR